MVIYDRLFFSFQYLMSIYSILMMILLDLQPNIETNVLNFVDHSCYFQVNFSSNRDVGNSVKVSSLCFNVIPS